MIGRSKYQQQCEATYPKRTQTARLVKFCRPTPRKAANNTQKETQHTVKLHGCWTKLFLAHFTLECHTIIAPCNPNPSKFKQYLRLFTNCIWHMHSGRLKCEFCTDTFRLTIRESLARDVHATIGDITTLYERLYVILSVIAGVRILSIVVWIYIENHVCYRVMNCFSAHERVCWCLFPKLLSNEESIHQSTLYWAQKQFVTRVHTLFYFLHDIKNP